MLAALLLVPAAMAVTAPTGATVTGTTQTSVTIGGLACGQTYSFAVRLVVNGTHSSAVTRTATTQPCVTPPPPPPPSGLMATSGNCSRTECANGYPLSAATCLSQVTPTAENILSNTTANHTPGDGSYSWGPDSTDPYWAVWAGRVPSVQGQATGSTDELIQWAACRWGVTPDLIRAVAVQESDWHQSSVGDACGPVGEASYGIIQIKNAYCSGQLSWGGYPDTQQSTPLALDFYGAYLRSCYDGVFNDGGSWLYHGQTVAQIAAANSWDYVAWGCVGSWFSGGWYDSGASSYISSVKTHLANRDWTKES